MAFRTDSTPISITQKTFMSPNTEEELETTGLMAIAREKSVKMKSWK
jgi:hypothetical protein